MAHNVFISYSHKDQPIADGICAGLEAEGLRCWIAPRDIGPGEDWPTAIATGIAGSKVMVLVFSQNSNISEEVSRELYLAANAKVTIIPFVIENVTPEAGKAYYLGRTHWLDAMNPPTNKQIRQLIERVQSLLETSGNTSNVAHVFSPARLIEFGQRVHRRKPWAIPVALILLVALIMSGITFIPKIYAAYAVGLSSPILKDASFYLHREDFNDKDFEGELPPNWELASDWCDNMKVVQENGFMTFQAPAKIKPGCNMGPAFAYSLSQVKAVEFVLGVTSETPANHSSFAFMLAGSNNDQKSFFMICGLNNNTSGCNVKIDQKDVYISNTFVENPGNQYTFRIEVLDPNLMSFRFLVDGETIGEYTMPSADLPVYKDLTYHVGGGVVGRDDMTRAGVYLLDYLAVEQR